MAVALTAVDPQRFATALGLESLALALLVGAAALLGVAVIPLLGRMGRTGAVLLATVALAVTILSVVGIPSIPPSTGLVPLDLALALALPAGYLLLLFGALRSLGMARRGAIVATVIAILMAVAVPLVGPAVDQIPWMAERAVLHALLIVGAVVSGIAALIEFARRPDGRPRASEGAS